MDPEKGGSSLGARLREGVVLARLDGIGQRAAQQLGGGVPAPVRAILEQGFAERIPWGRASVVWNQRGALGEQLASLTAADWDRLADTLLPDLAPAAKATLAALSRRPFQVGPTRKPFRAPHSPQTLADLRSQWLLHTTLLLGDYDADVRWVAARGATLAGFPGVIDIGWLLAGAIDAGGPDGQAVHDTLLAAARGEHEVAEMGQHVVRALLTCGRPDAWAFVERLLLSAQREEGLRQSILESVDEAHPEAFRRMLRLILDEKLTRFSSVVRAADTWFGFMWDGASAVAIDEVIRRVLTFLEDPAACMAALDDRDAETAYLALWSLAFDDVDAAIAPAARMLGADSTEHRFVAAHFLVQTCWTLGLPPLVDALADADLRVAARALDAFQPDVARYVDGERLFDRLEALLGRLAKRSQKLEALVWPWWARKLERPAVAAALATNAGAVPVDRLLPHVPDLDPYQREAFVRRAAGLHPRWNGRGDVVPRRTPTAGERALILDLLGDASAEVRAAAFLALAGAPALPDEVDRLVDLLARKPGDLRNGALTRLRTLDDAALLAVADRLLADASDLRRLAGLELLRDAVEAGRMPADARARLVRYAAARATLTDQERTHIDAVGGGEPQVATADDALGLLAGRAPREWPSPRTITVDVETPGARASLAALAELVLAHQTEEVRTPTGEVRLLVESVSWGFGPRRRDADDATEPPLPPLADVWRGWVSGRSDALRDPDGLELLRALLADARSDTWQQRPVRDARGLGQWNAGSRFLYGLLEWCIAWDPPLPGGTAFLLDGLEQQIAALTPEDHRAMAAERTAGASEYAWVDVSTAQPWHGRVAAAELWLARFRWWRGLFPSAVSPEDTARLYGLLRGFEARAGGFDALRVTLDDFLAAYRVGAADEPEFVDLLVGRWSHRARGSLLRHVSSRKPPRELVPQPALLAAVDRCRRRVVEVECARGDRESAASRLAMELRGTGGLDTLARAIPALGTAHFTRNGGWSASAASRQDTLSHLVVRTAPRDDDTPEAFARWARRARVNEARLVELAVYAPQWAEHVAHVLGWPGLAGAVWWIHAHTKDDRSWQLDEMKELWAAQVSEHTPLSAADLTEGAVDVAWFRRVHDMLGPERWQVLDAAAKYAASAGGHARARLFARAMAGDVSRDELLARIAASRHQDSVRALGLVPLADGEAGAVDLLERYRVLEAFRRDARQFGAQRRESESRAVDIGMANLARTAGYRDPQRLRWAMERAAVGELARGPLVVNRGDVSVSLAVDGDGVPALTVARGGKALKALPAALKQDEEMQALKERHQDLKRQHARVRDALEAAMCRGDRFTAAELQALCEHPILAPALARLVFVGDGVAGYLAENGRALRDHAGTLHVLGREEEVRVAHPTDLFARGDWSAWQRECFAAERVQPFKQVFRELYPATAAERETDRSRRYAGHQLNPRQALAVLGGRGWVARPEEGVSRTFHEAGLTARLGVQEAFHTPAEVEGLTLEEVVFTRKGEWDELPLAEVPAHLFSEAMRDLDLAVSVAHRGGVDPEATASTVEMRARLVQETCALLGIDNVELEEHHAIVRGALAHYAVHLGSAGVIVLPATALPIVAVHAQHRGRLFLPFADDDPRTAEVLSKVLLLARDRDIRDPNIRAAIHAASETVNA